MQRFNERQGFLFSAIVHMAILMLLVRPPVTPIKPEPQRGAEAKSRAVFIPSATELRRVLPAGPRPPRPLRPTPAPPRPVEPPKDPARAKDRISIGPPSDERSKTLLLRKEDDLMAVPKGLPNAAPTPLPSPPPTAAVAQAPGGAPEVAGAPGLKLPPGLGEGPRGAEGTRGRPGPPGPSIGSSLRNLDKALQASGPRGIVSGTGRQMGPLFFDPEGADFTAWISHFKDEVYRNWILPEPALLGFRGHVDIEFTVERDGALTNLRLVKSSGTPALDRAAQNALQGSRFLPLPPDYGPPRISMQVSFFYNEGPQGS